MECRSYRVSDLSPMEDETLISFLQRAQTDGDRTDSDFHALIAGSPLADAWRAERRSFDWSSVSRFVNASPEELHRMSQRGMFCSLMDETKKGDLKHRAPWLSRRGYGAHCPCCVRESAHWRQTWTRPTAIVCEKHRTVLLHHCDECGAALDSLNWTQVRPICPNCHHHLSLGPVVPASAEMSEEAARLNARFDAMVSRVPLAKTDFDLAHFAAVWRAAQMMNADDNCLVPVREEILALRGIRRIKHEKLTAERALRYAENIISAHLLSEMEPTFSQHFWMSVTDRRSLACADHVVLEKLRDIAGSLSICLDATFQASHQLTMSFDNWDGSNGRLSAA